MTFAVQLERCLVTFNVRDFVNLHNQYSGQNQETLGDHRFSTDAYWGDAPATAEKGRVGDSGGFQESDRVFVKNRLWKRMDLAAGYQPPLPRPRINFLRTTYRQIRPIKLTWQAKPPTQLFDLREDNSSCDANVVCAKEKTLGLLISQARGYETW